jgi:hypothetical protein
MSGPIVFGRQARAHHAWQVGRLDHLVPVGTIDAPVSMRVGLAGLGDRQGAAMPKTKARPNPGGPVLARSLEN